MSLHPRNIEPSEGTMYLTCSLAWLCRGWLSPQGGAQSPPSSVQIISFSCCRHPFCTALHSFLQVHLPFLWTVLWHFGLSQISVCPVDRLGNFAAPFCFCLHKWIFPDFPLGHVSGWHGLFFKFFPVFLGRDGVWLCCRTGKVGGSSLGPVGLEARLPHVLTVHFFLSHCLGWGVAASVWKFLFLRSLGLGLPQSGDEAMTL